MKKIIHLAVYITAIYTALFCGFSLNCTDYAALLFLPVTYLFTYILFTYFYQKTSKYKITIILVLILLWMRMVYIPYYGTISGNYNISLSYFSNVIQTAISLSIYECFVICITLAAICHKNTLKITYSYQPKLYGSRFLYLIFIIIACCVFLFIGRHLNLLEFGVKAVGTDLGREGDIVDTRLIIIRQIISSGYLFLFFYLIERFRHKHSLLSDKKYVNYAIVLAALMTCIIVGERRTAQIYIAFASCWTLIRTFPENRKQIVSIIGSTALGVLMLMTIYKHFNAFLYDSYNSAIQNASIDQGFSAGIIDAYFYGINTIVKNISYGQIANLNLNNMLYDIFRSIFGLNFVLKGGMLTTSEAYNSYLYSGTQLTGLLLSSVGYGYIYFGFILAPIFTCLNICIMTFLEIKMRVCRSIEMSYILAYIYMRIAFGLLGSIPPLINVCTQFLFINGAIFLGARVSFKKYLK